MSSRLELPNIREIQVLSNQETSGLLRGSPNCGIVLALKLFTWDCIHIVPKSA